MTGSEHDPATRGGLPAGFDEEDPYEGENLEEYPDWWRESIQEFRRYGLRPYRPPRFTDGELVPPFIEGLEAEIGREIRLRTLRPGDGDAWEVLVGRERVATVPHYRHSDGYSVYDVESEIFGRLVREEVDG